MISVDLDIWSILDISEIQQRFEVQFKMTMRWKDPRLTYSNLKKDYHMNIVSHEDSADIWFPVVVSLNTMHLDESLVSVLFLLLVRAITSERDFVKCFLKVPKLYCSFHASKENSQRIVYKTSYPSSGPSKYCIFPITMNLKVPYPTFIA